MSSDSPSSGLEEPSLDGLVAPERRGATQALRELEAGFAAGARVVALYGAAGSLGAALAARLSTGSGPLVYLCADDDVAESRADDLAFFLPHAGASDDPLAPP